MEKFKKNRVIVAVLYFGLGFFAVFPVYIFVYNQVNQPLKKTEITNEKIERVMRACAALEKSHD